MAIFNKEFDFYAGTKKIELNQIHYILEEETRRTDISSLEVVDEIRKVYPDFMPNSFLNGSVKTDSYKWLLAGRMGNKHEVFGYAGPKFIEAAQTLNHLFFGRYLAYSRPVMMGMGLLYFLIGCFDKGIRESCKNYFKSLILNPKAFFSKVNYQSVMVIQPIDFMENGEPNMCDGCPDITVWDGKLVWSCRLEEQYKWGENIRVLPKEVQIEN